MNHYGRILVAESNIDQDTKNRVYSCEDYLVCEIEYKGGRLVISKNYQNTQAGKKEMKSFLTTIKSGEDVEKYFKIKGGLKMSLDTTVEEMKKASKFATENVEGGNPSTQAGRAARKKSSQERLKQLYVQYKEQLKERALFVLVTGTGAKEFSAISTEEASFYETSTESFYEFLTDKIDARLYKNPIKASYVMDALSRHFEEVAKDLGISSYNQIIATHKYSFIVKTRDGVLLLIKKVVNEILGAEVAALYAFEFVAKKAFEENFNGPIFPVMVETGSDTVNDLVKGFMILNKKSPKVFTVAVGESDLVGATYKVKDSEKKTVIETLNKIKKTIMGKAPKGKKTDE